jgi:hypothetical protein
VRLLSAKVDVGFHIFDGYPDFLGNGSKQPLCAGDNYVHIVAARPLRGTQHAVLSTLTTARAEHSFSEGCGVDLF